MHEFRGVGRRKKLPWEDSQHHATSRLMATLQVKHVPDQLHQRLREYARQHHRTLSEVVLEALERELARAEFLNRLAARPPTDLGIPAATLLEEVREERGGNPDQ